MNRLKDLERVLELYLVEGRKLAIRKKVPSSYCHRDCAGCLAAEARGNVDDRRQEKGEFGILGMFSSREDVCLMEARDILADEFNLVVY